MIMKKIKIFTNLDLIETTHLIHLLHPFEYMCNKLIPLNKESNTSILSGMMDEYDLIAKDIYELVDCLDDADFAVLPVQLNHYNETTRKEVKDFISYVVNSDCKLIIFASQDIEPNFSFKNTIILSSAIYRSKKLKNTFPLPFFFEDFIKIYANNNLTVREKETIPTVGFCGYAPPINLSFSKEKIIGTIKLFLNHLGVMDKFPNKSSHSYRARVLINLYKSKLIKDNFLIKSEFGFGPLGLNTASKNETNLSFRTNYVNNIVNSDYIVCVRGIGNNSIRFYETLCCGRIPVVLDTDIVLPLNDIIDWKKLIVWIEREDIDIIDKKIYEFHQNISNEDFLERQKLMRKIWENYFSPHGYLSKLHYLYCN